jgi:hypothetical protein
VSFPNTFIVGAAKTGTTSLHNYLGQHPQVFMSAWKEPHFFADIEPDPKLSHMMRRVGDEQSYRALFAAAGNRPVIGESSPSYLWDPGAAARIHARVPQARIIILLRDPIARAHSHYLMDVREGLQTLPFPQALAADTAIPDKRWGGAGHLYVELGLYAAQVARYLDLFPPEQVRIHLFDDLQHRPHRVLEDLAEFLHIDPAPMQSIDTGEAHNPFAQPRSRAARLLMAQTGLRQWAQRMVPASLRRTLRDRVLLRRGDKPVMEAEALDMLRAIYEPDLRQLEARLARPLPELRRSWQRH